MVAGDLRMRMRKTAAAERCPSWMWRGTRYQRLKAGPVGPAFQSDQRLRKNLRRSSVTSSGRSREAKWPPLS